MFTLYIFTGLKVMAVNQLLSPIFLFHQPFVGTLTGKFILSCLEMNVFYNKLIYLYDVSSLEKL